MNFSTELTAKTSAVKILENLYPAVIDVFVVILSGYACGRSGLISEVQGQGLNVFVSKFALPAMLFRSMATLKFGRVNWILMLCVMISKSIVFFSVLIFALVLSSRPTQYGRAGIFAIFASQSNDFALGYPILEALYGETHPELLQYIFLVAPISLLFLNPIGFCLMEMQNHYKDSRQLAAQKQLWYRTAWKILVGVATNPINFMTFVGVLANLAFHQHLPAVVDGALATFGNAFSAGALFYLGLKMVGRVKSFHGFRLVVPVLLMLAKLLFFPLIARAVIGQLHPINNHTTTLDYANFGFLYGTIPAAPTVFVFATQYSMEIDTVGTALVLSTLMSGPWMFVSAEMLSIQSVNMDKYGELLSSTQFNVGILGALCTVWVICVLVFSRRWRRVPHIFTMGLLLSQVITFIGIFLWRFGSSHVLWQHYLQFFLFLSGVLGTRIWTAGIAIALYLMNSGGLLFLSRFWWIFFLVAYGVPALLTVLLFATGDHTQHDKNPAFHYGFAQVVLSAAVLCVCFVVTIAMLILSHIKHRERCRYRALGRGRYGTTDEDRLLAEDPDCAEETLFDMTADPECVLLGTIDLPLQFTKSIRLAGATVHWASDFKLVRLGYFCILTWMAFLRNYGDDRVAGNITKGKRGVQKIVSLMQSGKGVATNKELQLECLPHFARLADNLLRDVDESSDAQELTLLPISTKGRHEDVTVTSDGFVGDFVDESAMASQSYSAEQRKNFGDVDGHYNTDSYRPVALPGTAGGSKGGLTDPHQHNRHVVLLLCLATSMLIGIFVCFWRIFVTDSTSTGIFVELEFMDSVLMFGQGCFAFVVFGLDAPFSSMPWCQRLIHLLFRKPVD